MKRMVAVVLITLLVAPPAPAGQRKTKPTERQTARVQRPLVTSPLTRAEAARPTPVNVVAEVGRVHSADIQGGATTAVDSQWHKLLSLDPGRGLRIKLAGQKTEARATFAWADENQVVAILSDATPARGVRKALGVVTSGGNWPVIARGGRVRVGDMSIALDGVYEGDQQVAALSDVVLVAHRQDVESLHVNMSKGAKGSIVFFLVFGVPLLIGVLVAPDT